MRDRGDGAELVNGPSSSKRRSRFQDPATSGANVGSEAELGSSENPVQTGLLQLIREGAFQFSEAPDFRKQIHT